MSAEKPFNLHMADQLIHYAAELMKGTIVPQAIEVERFPHDGATITMIMKVPAKVRLSIMDEGYFQVAGRLNRLTNQSFQWKIDNEWGDEQIEGPQHHVR